MVNDGVVDANHASTKPFVLTTPNTRNNNVNSIANHGNNPPSQRNNTNQYSTSHQGTSNNNQGYRGNNNNHNSLGNTSNSNPQRFSFFSSRRTFTPLGQSLESAFKELMAKNVITLLPQQNYEPSINPPSWNEAYYCDYH